MSGSAGLARLTARATESAFQYEKKAIAPDATRAMTMPTQPKPATRPTAKPMRATTPTKPATSRTERRLLARISSNMGHARHDVRARIVVHDAQNSTVGTVRAASSVWKYSRFSNFSRLA